MKSNTVKKVLTIIILSLVAAVVITTIVLAVVPKTLYNPIVSDYFKVAVYKDGNFEAYMNDNDEQKVIYNKITELHNDSVEDSILSSMFQGTGKFESKILYESSAINAKDTVAKAKDSFCLVFEYKEEKTLMFDGKKATHPNSKNSDKTITYTKIYMPVENTNDYQKCKIYLTGSDDKSSYQIEFLTHQSDLYDYLKDLKFQVIPNA